MWTPYKNAAGQRIPSVTTILSRFKESGALLHWAWQQGVDGKDFRETRDKAADAGTCAHAMIEAHLKSQNFVREGWTPESLAKGEMAFHAFQTWADGTQLTPHASEVRMVSEAMQVGGTADMIVTHNNSFGLLDIKTGAIYADHLYQVAAYAMLWDEAHPEQPITGGYHLCRFNRDSGDFSHSYFGELEEAKRGFKLMVELYKLDQGIKKRVK